MDNILCFKDKSNCWRYKICDFGFTDFKDNVDISEENGTPGYIAPEIFDSIAHINGDMFSAGVILFSILTRRFPFYDKEKGLIFWKNKRATIVFRAKIWNKISKAAKNLV